MDYLEHKKQAISNLKIADHILIMTYPIVQDPKLLKTVLERLYIAIENAMATLLFFEKQQRKISAFNASYVAMLEIIRTPLIKYNISPNYLIFLNELNDIYQLQKKSDVEFIRKEKFVFTNKDYKLNIITKEDMKKYLIKGKLFINEINDVVK